MPRHLTHLSAALLLGVLGWNPAQASLTSFSCAGDLGTYDPSLPVPCVDISLDGLSIEGSGPLPLGTGTGVKGVGNNNKADPTYADVLTHVAVSGSGSGLATLGGGPGGTLVGLQVSFNLLLEDIDPVYGFANGAATISRDFALDYIFDAATGPFGLIGTSLVPLNDPIELPLKFDVNDNTAFDSLFVESISLDTLAALLVDIVVPTDDYASVSLAFGSATGSFDGYVADALTDPPFSIGLAGSAAVPAPGGLLLLALGGLIGALARRFKQA